MEIVADHGFKAFSFWNADEEEREAMLKVQQRTGLKCASISGTGSAGTSTGLTQPGAEAAYFDEVATRAKIAANFGGAQPIIFVGRTQPDIPWETATITDRQWIAESRGYRERTGRGACVEPLSTRAGQARMALDTAAAAFPVMEEVAHPNVKICFDMYHLQLMEGNIVDPSSGGPGEELDRTGSDRRGSGS